MGEAAGRREREGGKERGGCCIFYLVVSKEREQKGKEVRNLTWRRTVEDTLAFVYLPSPLNRRVRQKTREKEWERKQAKESGR